MARPMTSGGPQGRMNQINAGGNNLMSKPMPMMNAFSSGSKADLSQQNPIELAPTSLNKQGSKQQLYIGGGTTSSMMGIASQPVSAQGYKTLYSNSGIGGNIGLGYNDNEVYGLQTQEKAKDISLTQNTYPMPDSSATTTKAAHQAISQ